MFIPYVARVLAVFSMAVAAFGLAVGSLEPGRDGGGSREIARIRHHLEGAEDLLGGRDLSALAPAQREARSRRIAELNSYLRRGVFPHNHQLPGHRTPVFVDGHGTRCAMAYLIEQSGDRELVSRIARTRNLARIHDLAGDAALVAWLDRNGITADEAARIQPEYDGEVYAPDRDLAAAISGAVGALSGTCGVSLNLSLGGTPNARNARSLVGVIGGLAGMGFGVYATQSGDGGIPVLGAADIGLGIASLALGIRQLNGAGKNTPSSASRASPVIWRDRTGVTWAALVTRF